VPPGLGVSPRSVSFHCILTVRPSVGLARKLAHTIADNRQVSSTLRIMRSIWPTSRRVWRRSRRLPGWWRRAGPQLVRAAADIAVRNLFMGEPQGQLRHYLGFGELHITYRWSAVSPLIGIACLVTVCPRPVRANTPGVDRVPIPSRFLGPRPSFVKFNAAGLRVQLFRSFL